MGHHGGPSPGAGLKRAVRSVAHHHALAARVRAAHPQLLPCAWPRDGLQAAGHVHPRTSAPWCAQGLRPWRAGSVFLQQRRAVHRAEVGQVDGLLGHQAPVEHAIQASWRCVDDGRAAGLPPSSAARPWPLSNTSVGDMDERGRLPGCTRLAMGWPCASVGAKLKSVSSVVEQEAPLRAAFVVTICRAPNWSSMVVVMATALPKASTMLMGWCRIRAGRAWAQSLSDGAGVAGLGDLHALRPMSLARSAR